MEFTIISRDQAVAVLASEPRPPGGLAAKYHVTLTEEERTRLEALTHAGRVAARTLTHAWILLKADAGPGAPAWSDAQIRDAFGVGWSTIARVRRAVVEEGLDAALYPKRPPPRLPTKLDGANEAHLIALACTTPPAGHERWTLRLLAERFVTLEGETISYETVRRALKKTNSSRGGRTAGVSRPRRTRSSSRRWKTCSPCICAPRIRRGRWCVWTRRASNW
jgi:transposase